MLLVCFFWILLPGTLAYPFCVDPTEDPCTSCVGGYSLLQDVCLEKCPSGCPGSCGTCSFGNVFDVKFYENTDIQVKSKDYFDQTTDFTGSGVISRTDPSPTKERGYRFSEDSSFTSNQEFLPGLTNTLIYWIRATGNGRIATMAESYTHYKVDKIGGNWTLTIRYTNSSDGNYEREYLDIQGATVVGKR